MSQLNVNALRQPNAAPLNGAPVGGQQIGAPAGLGNNHSVGRTIGRVIAAIFTLGISEAVRAIIRAVRAESAPAVPHLPQNRELSSHALRALEQGKNRALATLGAFCEVDAAALQKRLEEAVDDELEPMNDAALEELAEKTARAVLMESIVKAAVKDEPEGATVATDLKDALAIHLFDTEQAQRLANAPDADAAPALVATVKDLAREKIRSRVNMTVVKQEFLGPGLQSFREATGCNEKLNTLNLESTLHLMHSKLNEDIATTARPYAEVGQDDLRKALKPKADLFFADRATAYNSIAKLDVPDSLKTLWRKTCLQTKAGLSGKTFEIALAAGRELAKLPVGILLSPNQTVREKLNFLGDMSKSRTSLFVKAFGAEQYEDMGEDEKSLMLTLVQDVIETVHKDVLTSVRADPALVDTLMEAAEVLQNQAFNYIPHGEGEEKIKVEMTSTASGIKTTLGLLLEPQE